MKKNLLTMLVLVFVVAFSAVCFTACGKAETLTVKFMVEENGEWKEGETLNVVEGAVEVPTAPAKEFYDFVGWFTDKEGTTPFTAKDIKENISVYAKYQLIKVNAIFDGAEGVSTTLYAVANDEYKVQVAEGLEFDGWYKDENFNDLWDKKEVVSNLYARSVAVITIDNGYENIYTAKVVPGEAFANPAEQKVTVDGVETTLEASFLKDYMSDKNIDYVDAEGNAFDFTKGVEQNTNITVLWNSKISDSQYKLNEKTGNYYLQPGSLPDAPVISLRSDLTIMVKEGETEVAKDITVEAIEAYGTMDFIKPTVKKIIIGEGFKAIKSISGDGTCLVEEVVIPSSAIIIDNSFNNMPKLKSVSIPEGVKAIIGSFVKQTTGDRRNYYQGAGYDFDIDVPASVVNMAMVPNNFVFAEGSTFSNDNGYIYQTTEKGKVLVSDPNAYANFSEKGKPMADTIVVPEGVVGIQAGTYVTAYNYLMLPASFKFVNYNLNLADNPFYIFGEGSTYANANNMLYDESSKDAPSTTMNGPAYAISTTLGGDAGIDASYQLVLFHAGKVVFPSNAVPAELDKYAFANVTTPMGTLSGQYVPMDDPVLSANVILKDDVNKVYVTTSFDGETANLELTDATLNADTIKDAIIAKLSAGVQDSITKAFKGVKFFENGKEVTLGEVKGDMFLTMEISIARLVVASNWRVGITGSGYSSEDYNKPAEATKFIDGTVKLDKFDLTDMTIESLKAELMTLVLEAANSDDTISFGAPESAVLEANIKYFYENATVKLIANGEEITDLSKITLDNGEVKLEVVYEF